MGVFARLFSRRALTFYLRMSLRVMVAAVTGVLLVAVYRFVDVISVGSLLIGGAMTVCVLLLWHLTHLSSG